MAEQRDKPKRGRGRPRVHKGEAKTLSVRTTEKRFNLIHGLLATIRVADKRMDATSEALILEALEQRVRGLENQSPELVRYALAKTEKNR